MILTLSNSIPPFDIMSIEFRTNEYSHIWLENNDYTIKHLVNCKESLINNVDYTDYLQKMKNYYTTMDSFLLNINYRKRMNNYNLVYCKLKPFLVEKFVDDCFSTHIYDSCESICGSKYHKFRMKSNSELLIDKLK